MQRSGGWERRERNMMGIKDLTYHKCQAVTWDKCISVGDQIYWNNSFAWDKVVLNVSGTE